MAHLLWLVAPGSRVTVERDAGSGWAARGERIADGAGRVTFDDGELAAGARIGWRVRVGPGGAVGGETWLTVPAAQAFALHGVFPNPSAGDLMLSFSLAERAQPTIEVLDVQGRRVLVSDLGVLEAGDHRVRLATTLGPGLYFARLRQGARRATTRFVRVE